MTQSDDKTNVEIDEQQSKPSNGRTPRDVPGNQGAPDEQGDSDRPGRHGRPSDDADPGHS